MKLTMLGTGHAMVYNCFNTCFVLEEGGKYLLVDGGGGFELLKQMKKAEISPFAIHDIFVTHKHLDHITGILWYLRLILQSASRGRKGECVRIYGHEEVIHILKENVSLLLGKDCEKQLGTAMELIAVEDGEHQTVLGKDIVFFDIHAEKAKQFGFSMEYEEGKHLVCLGDEPYNVLCESYVRNSTWCMHEAFCLDSDGEIYHPERIRHSTVKSACETMQSLNVGNLILYHTEDSDIEHRRQRYTEEGKEYFAGSLHVPDDLETILL